MLSRKARFNSHGQDSSYFLGWEEYQKNPYHHLHNPTGIIQMGLAENQAIKALPNSVCDSDSNFINPFHFLNNLSFDIIESWLENNPDATGFHRNGKSLFRELALFQDYRGLPSFKNELADFMGEIRGNKVRFDPNRIVLTAGSTSANEALMFCLAEPGDAFLLPTPYYPGFDRDLKWRTGVEIVPISCSSSNKFRITKPALEEAYQHAQKLNLTVKGVLITNPSNPLGTSMTRAELNHLISFAIAKQIHIVSDEIYSGTVFDTPSFISITQAMMEYKNLEDTGIWNRVHIVYSLSKDLGLPGFRVGMIYSNNQTVVAAATKMSSFGLVSSQTQHLLTGILADKNFIKSYIDKNKKRIKKRKQMLVSGLLSVGIDCLKSNAGLFCWVDMRHLLRNDTFEAEMELWKKVLYEVGLNVSPGSSCHCGEPGWFRLCFANMSKETLKLSVKRIKAFMDSVGGIDSSYTNAAFGWRI
ncbi:hypothetical protein ACSBR2_000715 [Camellia fascicularis]